MKKRVNYNILELKNRSQFIPAKGFDTSIELIRIKKNTDYSYELPVSNKLNDGWWENLSWNKDILRNFLAYPEVHFFMALYEGEVIGSFDLIVLPDRQVEIKNFGMVSDFVDFEVRAMLLSKAVDHCFQFEPKRIFFHANEFDKMSAISNYLSQGFIISTHDHELKAENNLSEKINLQSNFLINLN
ncbi:GNAT family N-acetyltransferase [Carboxylicivirga sp. M1479]|uniref:GNAT family N-acetyltransferase n=1 Tax=Carboxylicivirga sp. M1479 TaxID=2594476 RepID=UPI0011781B68|nr:GNAT family N-acetyltransferase [Carboxylicivirga sp. M1479]TRX71215.1 GNAT family N-acetyltransferase [Carboxylicivirga sp. M1479]